MYNSVSLIIFCLWGESKLSKGGIGCLTLLCTGLEKITNSFICKIKTTLCYHITMSLCPCASLGFDNFPQKPLPEGTKTLHRCCLLCTQQPDLCSFWGLLLCSFWRRLMTFLRRWICCYKRDIWNAENNLSLYYLSMFFYYINN